MKKLLQFLVCSFLVANNICVAKISSFEGIAVDKKTGKFIYKEVHKITYDLENKVKNVDTSYLNAEDKVIANLKSDFTKSTSAPDHVFEDMRFKDKYELISKGNVWSLGKVFLKNEKLVKQSTTLVKEKEQGFIYVAGPGLFFYLQSLGDGLKAKFTSPLKIKFIIPGKLDYYNFTMNLESAKQDKYKFKLVPRHLLFKVFGPDMKFLFNNKNRRLISYEGLSNVKSPNGKLGVVKIEYKYNN